MTVTRIQTEPEVIVETKDNRLQQTHSFSDQTLATTLESVLFGFIIRKYLTSDEIELLDRHFTENSRLMIVAENKCIYPVGPEKGECSICVVLKENQINVCDLNSNHTELVDIVEQNWPAMLDAAVKVNSSFEKNFGSILINRLSGRIFTVNKGVTALTGMASSEFEGKEFGKLFQRISNCIYGKKLNFENFTAGDICLCQVVISSPVQPSKNETTSGNAEYRAENNPHRFIEETDTSGLHLNRFNALVKQGVEHALSEETSLKLDTIVSQADSKLLSVDTALNKAMLRLLLQSVVMAQKSIAGENSNTSIDLKVNKKSVPFIEIATTFDKNPTAVSISNSWFEAALEIGAKTGLCISEPKFTKNIIVNRIHRKNIGK